MTGRWSTHRGDDWWFTGGSVVADGAYSPAPMFEITRIAGSPIAPGALQGLLTQTLEQFSGSKVLVVLDDSTRQALQALAEDSVVVWQEFKQPYSLRAQIISVSSNYSSRRHIAERLNSSVRGHRKISHGGEIVKSIWLTLFAVGTLLLLTACSDPYEREIPASGFVAAGEAEDIARQLAEPDKDLFRRWAKRAPTSERFPGEAIPRSIRSALINQTRFEALQAEKAAKDAEKIAEDQRVSKEKQKKADEQRDAYQKMKEADAFIKEFFIANPVSYNLVPIFNSYGALSYREWQFKVRLTNRTSKNIIGVSGLAFVKNAFGEEIDWYEFRVEPKVAPGTTIDYTFTMRHNPKDPAHLAMLNTETLFFEWVFDSLAFSDGTKLDYQSLVDSGDIQPNSIEGQKPITSI